ncbi:hypothetical protein MJO29_013746 [Puccinia striiformis f. sp. tritici]|nr:hypothetical protein MJO29_013746 [Puccinia striiformis f. sp. tritici]
MESQKDEHVQPGLEAPHHLNGTALLMNARDAALVKRAKLKLDLLLLPILGLFFFLSFLDRANLGNVRIIGLQKDLHMTDYDFSMALTVTFIPYILIELPSNLLVHKIGAGIQIPLTVTIWGLITCLQGLVTSYRGLLVSRFFLGLVEGGLYPAVVLYLSTFYTRSELQLRIALFWGTICISGAASGLLTYAIIKLHGHWGHPGWAWVFLASLREVLAGVLVDDLTSVNHLTLNFNLISILPLHAEKRCLISRLGPAWMSSTSFTSSATYIQRYPAKSTILQVWEAFKSPHVILLSIAQFGCASNIYSLAYFAPTIVNTFGYSPTTTQLFTVPPFAVGFIFLVGMSYWSDKRQTRAHASVISAVLSIIGFAIFYASSSAKVRYGSLFISIPGAYAVSPSLGAWTADNSEPHKRKATAIALGAMVANSGGLFSVWIFVLGKKPRYHLPTAFNIFFGVAIIVCCILNTIWLSHAQKKKVAKRSDILEKFGLRSASASFKQEENESQDQLSEHDMMSAKAWDDLGDQHPDFKYIY